MQEIDGNFFERFGSRLKEAQEFQRATDDDEKDGVQEDLAVLSVVEPLQAMAPKEMLTSAIGWNVSLEIFINWMETESRNVYWLDEKWFQSRNVYWLDGMWV